MGMDFDQNTKKKHNLSAHILLTILHFHNWLNQCRKINIHINNHKQNKAFPAKYNSNFSQTKMVLTKTGLPFTLIGFIILFIHLKTCLHLLWLQPALTNASFYITFRILCKTFFVLSKSFTIFPVVI